MNLQSNTPEFVESFCEQCLDRGLPLEKAAQLLYRAQLDEALQDPDFAQGFAQHPDACTLTHLKGL
jgi:hypothetical protein